MLGNNWFECKVVAEKTIEGGLNKPFKETYLVDALNCTSAEARILEEVGPFCSGSLIITGIKHVKISELFISDNENADKWYKAKINFITLDEKTQKEKKTSADMIIQAFDFEDAFKRLKEGMKGTMMDYQIAVLQETTLMDVFPFNADGVQTNDNQENDRNSDIS